MRAYVDMHSHILPRIDDGAQDFDMAKSMLRMACSSGIWRIITTPHYHYEKGNVPLEQIRAQVARLEKEAVKINPNMRLYTGGELYYDSSMVEKLDKKEVPTLANSRYVLMEFAPEVEYSTIKQAIYECNTGGYYPIIAHAERYQVLLNNPATVAPLISSGAYIQVNIRSVTGDNGKASQKFVKILMTKEMLHFVGSDCHDDLNRNPSFTAYRTYMGQRFGWERLNRYLYYNPFHILENKEL